MTPDQALENLRLAVRELPTKADTHEQLARCVQIIQEALNGKNVESKGTNS